MALNKKSIVEVIDQLAKVNGKDDPCKKTVQKIVYLIEEAGEDLGYKYSIHFYGPYSAELDYEIQELSARGILAINYTEHGHLLSAKKGLQSVEIGTTAKHIIATFGNESPSELELVATALFVQRETKAEKKGRIISGVKKIKGSKYSESQINYAITILQTNGYFSVS